MALYIVTGGAGFIGSHLTDALLAGGHQVRVLDDLSSGKPANLDPRCELVVCDVSDRSGLDPVFAGAAGVFHLAAIASVARSNEDWVGTHRANQGATVAVLDAARAAGRIPVVYASSAAVYGDGGGQPAREAAMPLPQTAYGADKLGSELHARVGWGIHGVPSLGCRLFNVYGTRQDPASPYSGVISIFAARALDGLDLRIYGDGAQSRDFIFVADVVAHLIAGMTMLASRPGAHVVNVCTGTATTVLDLAHKIARLSGRSPRLVLMPPRSGDIGSSVGDPAAARALLDVAARTGLADGLAATLPFNAERL
jgi:UDP-glucose 4-epimerase